MSESRKNQRRGYGNNTKAYIEHISAIINPLTESAAIENYTGRRPPTTREVRGHLINLGYRSNGDGTWRKA